MGIIQVLVLGIAAYASIGVVFAIAFVTRGAGRVDPAAQGASVGVRILLVPGSVALWPMLGCRWLVVSKRKEAAS